MRIESSVTAVTWIPSEAIRGMPKLPCVLGMARYDEPPPDVLENLDKLHASNAFRAANELRAWVELDKGRFVDCGYEGRGLVAPTRLQLGPGTVAFPPTRLQLGPGTVAFPATELPLLQHEPETGGGWVRFVQTAGGRNGLPALRRVREKPYFRIASATAWTTLQLVIYADGRSEGSLAGASFFPRHWIYDNEGRLLEKSGTIDFEKWSREAVGDHTPWGGEDAHGFVTAVESELERSLSRAVMVGGGKLPRRQLEPGETLVEQGAGGDDLFLVVDGVLDVEVDGETVAQVGPGALLGERAGFEGARTATLRAVTASRIAVVSAAQISRYELAELARARGER